MRNLVGTVFTFNGVTLRVHAFSRGEYELRSTNTCGVWFATEAQLRAAGVAA